MLSDLGTSSEYAVSHSNSSVAVSYIYGQGQVGNGIRVTDSLAYGQRSGVVTYYWSGLNPGALPSELETKIGRTSGAPFCSSRGRGSTRKSGASSWAENAGVRHQPCFLAGPTVFTSDSVISRASSLKPALGWNPNAFLVFDVSPTSSPVDAGLRRGLSMMSWSSRGTTSSASMGL